MLGPEHSEGNLRYILRNASRRSGRIFEIFKAKEKASSELQSTVRWDERKKIWVEQEDRARRNVQDADDEDDHYCTEACEWIAKNMLKYLEDREVTKVSTRELKERILSPNESSVMLCALRGRREMRKATIYLRSSDKERTRSSSPVWRGGRSN